MPDTHHHHRRPQRFIRLVEAHPNVRLWFSGHFHLSQNYADSISVVGGCAFVQTGVIGECNRDGNRCACVCAPARALHPLADSLIHALRLSVSGMHTSLLACFLT